MISAEPSDVSAVVLTTGESTTQESLESIERQTLRPRETIIVRNVSPFHNAMNTGIAQVKTPFLVQVDADMILDPHCIAALRGGMGPNIGIVAARLRDGLVGQVVGIKLFRTKCFETTVFIDSIAPDTDFVNAIEHAGWRIKYIGKAGPGEFDEWGTFGEHRPAYTPAYTYRKHLLEGSRYRHRRTLHGFLWRLHRLEASEHPLALMAQVGLARGIFLAATRDLLGPGRVDESFPQVDAFLHAQTNGVAQGPATAASIGGTIQEHFSAAYRLGAALFAAGDTTEFRRLMVELSGGDKSSLRWVRKVALCQGLLAHAAPETAMEADYERLREIADPDHDVITQYAGAVGLHWFVVTGANAAEYKASHGGEKRTYRQSQRAVVSSIDRRGRPRIKIPFRPFGHVACAEPERLSGMVWCLDLVKAGYIHAHVPTDRGPKKISVLGQLARNVAERAALNLVLPTSLDRTFRKLSRRRDPAYQPVAGRVLMMIPSFILGGAERQLVAAAAGLVQRGYDVRVLALNPIYDDDIPNVEDELSRLNIATAVASDFPTPRGVGWVRPQRDALSSTSLSELPPWLAEKIGSISLAIQHHRPAVIDTWLDVAAVLGGLAACSLGAPRIVAGQASLSIRHHVGQAVGYLQSGYRNLARSPNVVMTNNSAAGAADYESWLDTASGRIRVIYNGFKPATIRKPAQDEIAQFRAHLGFPADATVIGSLIRFVEDKDPLLWLDTAAEIAKARPDARFLLAGYGLLQDMIVDRARTLGLGDRLVLPGAVSDVGLVYAILDVVLLTSRVEGVPNVLVEAQAAGCSVVSVDVGGIREAVIEGRTARLAPQRTAQSLAQAVLATLADPDWRMRARREGPAFVAQRFGFERWINEILEAYGLPERAP